MDISEFPQKPDEDVPKDGGSAFPIPNNVYIAKQGGPLVGMSLRDYFAGQALVGNLARDIAVKGQTWYWESDMVTNLAASSYEIADAMLKARE